MNLKENTVQLLQNSMNKMVQNYLKSKLVKKIKSSLPDDKFDFENLVFGLWYYFVIIKLPSRNGFTIWAYEYKQMTLEELVEGKVWILNNWEKQSLFRDFNAFIKDTIRLANLRKRWHTQNSLDSFCIEGRDWLMKLHNDEKMRIYEKLIITETVREEDRKDYSSKITELEEYRQKKSLDIIMENIKKNPKQYKLLVVRYEELAETHPKFKKKNGDINFAEIAREIKKLNPRKLRLVAINQSLLRYRRDIGKLISDRV